MKCSAGEKEGWATICKTQNRGHLMPTISEIFYLLENHFCSNFYRKNAFVMAFLVIMEPFQKTWDFLFIRF